MPKTQIELPTTEQVEFFIETYIAEPLASSFSAMMNAAMNSQSLDAAVVGDDNGNDDDVPVTRGRGRRAAVENNDDDAPPARGRGRGRAAAADDELLNDDDLISANDDNGNDDDAPPARGRGRRAAVENNDDDVPVRRGRRAEANENEDDDPAPARGRRGPAAREEEPAPRGRGRRAAEPEPEEVEEAEPVTFQLLGAADETVNEYIDTYSTGYKAKDIKDDVKEAWGITLKGTDVALLASQAGEIYAAMEHLTALGSKKLDKVLDKFGLEPDYGRTKSEKTIVVIGARSLVEEALANYE